MERAAALLGEKELNVTVVALEVGYNSLNHFSDNSAFGPLPNLVGVLQNHSILPSPDIS